MTENDASPLSDLIRELSNEVTQAHRWIAEGAGLNGTDLMALHFVRSGEGQVTPKSLAAYLGLTSGATAILLNRLDARGLIVRSPHPTDRRAVLLSLGPEAESADFMNVREYLRSMNAEVIEALGPEETRIVRTFMTDLLQSTRDALQRLRTEQNAAAMDR